MPFRGPSNERGAGSAYNPGREMEPTKVARVEESDRFTRAAAVAERFLDNIESVVYGKREKVKLVVAALIAGGHVLFEDVPGTAKTVLARAIAQSIDGATPSRIQCTPDLQPTDVTGLSIFNQKDRDFEFKAGPIFANVDGETRVLPDPFFLLATDNPIEYEGTFPLPEAQLDRFLLRTTLGYPDADDERRILDEQRHGHPLRLLEPVVTVEDVQELRKASQGVYVDELIKRWIVDLVRATREHESVAIGSSVRGSLALERAARGWALLSDRSYVVPDDVDQLFLPVLMHRMVFRPAFLAEARRSSWDVAAGRFRDTCLEHAPPPVADPDAGVFALGARRG